MIPPSTTISEEGRLIRDRIRWTIAAVLALVLLAWVFARLDRSTVVDGPAGSTYVTTATGLAALYDVLDRAGRRPVRVLQPLAPAVLTGVDTYVVSDVAFTGFEEVEVSTLASFAMQGGTVVVLGQPPDELTEGLGVDVEWVGTAAGEATVVDPTPHAVTVTGSRFGTFQPGHAGTPLASSEEGDLAIRFRVGAGALVLVADSSVAHNATVDQADNIDFLGAHLTGATVFDEYRHGYEATPSAGILTSAPGNWQGAGALGAVVLVVALVCYGRRFGPPEPTERPLAPDRGAFLDSVSRSIRRTGEAVPSQEIRTALLRTLALPEEASTSEVAHRAYAAGVDGETVGELSEPGERGALAADRALAAMYSRKGRAS